MHTHRARHKLSALNEVLPATDARAETYGWHPFPCCGEGRGTPQKSVLLSSKKCRWDSAVPAYADNTVITASAPIAPAKMTKRLCLIAIMAAIKNVLSLIMMGLLCSVLRCCAWRGAMWRRCGVLHDVGRYLQQSARVSFSFTRECSVMERKSRTGVTMTFIFLPFSSVQLLVLGMSQLYSEQARGWSLASL